MSDTDDDNDDRTILSGMSGRRASAGLGSGNALPEATRLGEFEVKGVIGEGGFGIVYRAWDHSLQRWVALKEYMPASLAQRAQDAGVQVRSERLRETFEEGLKSFVKEAQLLAQFDHPSLVKVYRFWEANGTAYMVMPLYEGVTLKQRLRQLAEDDILLSEHWLMGLLAPLTEALAVIHAADCYHRDIAPDNIILLEDDGRPVLLDFGAARRVIGDMTQALTVILKPGYAPVEQYAEVPEMKQGPWTDVYALAATMHFAITGKAPPPSVGRLLQDSAVPLRQAAGPRFSEPLLSALDRALRVRPEDRTASIAELRADLGLPPLAASAGAAGAPVTQRGPGVPGAGGQTVRVTTRGPAQAPLARDEGRRRGLVIGAVAVASVGALGAGWWFSRPAAPGAGGKLADPAAALPAGASPQVGSTPVASTGAAAKPVPPLSQAFDLREEFGRVLAGQTPGFTVRAVATKPSLRIGRDLLGFQVTSSRDGYLQVLLLGPEGKLWLFYPNAVSADNRIKAGQTLALPQPHWPLTAAEPAGLEDFLVVVSAQPRDLSHLGGVREHHFLALPTGAAAAEARARWPASQSFLLGKPGACTTAGCDDYGAAAFAVEIVR